MKYPLSTMEHYRRSGIVSKLLLERSLTGVYRDERLGYGRVRFGEDNPFREFKLWFTILDGDSRGLWEPRVLYGADMGEKSEEPILKEGSIQGLRVLLLLVAVYPGDDIEDMEDMAFMGLGLGFRAVRFAF